MYSDLELCRNGGHTCVTERITKLCTRACLHICDLSHTRGGTVTEIVTEMMMMNTPGGGVFLGALY